MYDTTGVFHTRIAFRRQKHEATVPPVRESGGDVVALPIELFTVDEHLGLFHTPEHDKSEKQTTAVVVQYFPIDRRSISTRRVASSTKIETGQKKHHGTAVRHNHVYSVRDRHGRR